MCEEVEFSVQLSHGDRLRVEDVGISLGELTLSRTHLTSQCCLGVSQDVVALLGCEQFILWRVVIKQLNVY